MSLHYVSANAFSVNLNPKPAEMGFIGRININNNNNKIQIKGQTGNELPAAQILFFANRFCIFCLHGSAHLLRRRHTISSLCGKVLTVPPDAVVLYLSAHPAPGLCNNDVSWAGIMGGVQAVVDLPLVISHHNPQILPPHNPPLSYDSDAVETCKHMKDELGSEVKAS